MSKKKAQQHSDNNYHVCPLCGTSFFGFGHNPEPLARYEERCCDVCNVVKVIPARLDRLLDRKESK